MKASFAVLMVVVVAFPGCASIKYANVPKGEIGGRLTLEWIGADKFIYRPDAQEPFYFRRGNGELIQPKRMFTDGGSIPRPLWALRGYSPWGFGPAFVAHDWIFDAHHCGLPEVKSHTVFSAADVLSEVMKTLMEATNPQVLKSPSLLYTIDAAVRTPIAEKLWNEGKCEVPPPELMEPKRFAAPFSAREIRPGSNRWQVSYDLDALNKK
jgi:hypothetical protein